MILTIGSSDATNLLAGRRTKAFTGLLQRFVSDTRPYWNSFNSPINALRTGAILERKYLEVLGDDYFVQVKATHDVFNCCTASIDFGKMQGGKLVDFDELKTVFLTDFIDKIVPIKDLGEVEANNWIKKKMINSIKSIKKRK